MSDRHQTILIWKEWNPELDEAPKKVIDRHRCQVNLKYKPETNRMTDNQPAGPQAIKGKVKLYSDQFIFNMVGTMSDDKFGDIW